MELFIPGAKIKESSNPPADPIPTTTVGPGDLYTIVFPKLGVRYEEADIKIASKGDIPLKFKATIWYSDVFGKTHHTRCNGTYYGESGTFITEGEQEAT